MDEGKKKGRKEREEGKRYAKEATHGQRPVGRKAGRRGADQPLVFVLPSLLFSREIAFRLPPLLRSLPPLSLQQARSEQLVMAIELTLSFFQNYTFHPLCVAE